jgi:chromate transporter
LYGIKPVVIAIVFQALLGLGRRAVKGTLSLLIGLLSILLYFLGFNPILVLFGAGLIPLIVSAGKRMLRPASLGLLLPLTGSTIPLTGQAPFSLWMLFLTLLKIGSVLYGSGYVLLAFLHADFVIRLGWLTDQQLVDAIAVGQFTPGPVFTTATFIGYLLGGLPGAFLGTLGIFLPSFIFVAISNPLIPRLRASVVAGKLLDGVNIASLGLMAAVTWQLAQTSLIDIPTFLIGLLAVLLILRYKINSTWLIIGGAIAGYLQSLLV